MRASRRQLLAAGAAAPLASAVPAYAQAELQTIEKDLRAYCGFGGKQAGGPADNACGEWLAGELARAGYRIERQSVSVPWFAADAAELSCDGVRVPVLPQPIVVPTKDAIEGPLVRVDGAGRWQGRLEGAIALVDLPFAAWSSALAKPFRDPVAAAFAGGAVAAVAITNGPSGQAVALNADGRKPLFDAPLALIAPDLAGPLLAAAAQRRRASLTIAGRGGTRPAFNFAGRIDRGKRRWLAVSTPRSGWFACAAERGGGVAVWLHLARWAAGALPDHDLAFVCNTGHEYEYLGAAEAMKAIAPPVAETALWLHLGANCAARDWHHAAGRPRPLSSVDAQRYFSVTPDLLALARHSFAGQSGFQDPVSSEELAAGELVEVLAAGYRPAAGSFGIHRYHHTPLDDERCLHPPATASAAQAFRSFVASALAGESA